TCRISTPPCRGPRGAPAPAVARSRSARCGPCKRSPMAQEDDQLVRAAAETIARRSYGKLVAFLAARAGDVTAAEDALSDAFSAALADWPLRGIPENPQAWLVTVARRKAVDQARRRRTRTAAAAHIKLIAEELSAAAAERTDIPDERLSLMFACAHPAIDP